MDSGVYGFETHFGEPVVATVYYDPSVTTPEKMKVQIEQKLIIVENPEGAESINLNFEVVGKGEFKGNVNLAEYNRTIFRPYDRLFNGYNRYYKDELKMLVFPLPEAANSGMRRYFGSLASHLSADEGVVRLSTRYLDVPSCIIFYDPSQTDAEQIKASLIKPYFTIFISDTETKDVENPFNFNPDGKIYSFSELNIDEE
jgi:hypothetical protein